MLIFHIRRRAHKGYTFVLSVIYNNQRKVQCAGKQSV